MLGESCVHSSIQKTARLHTLNVPITEVLASAPLPNLLSFIEKLHASSFRWDFLDVQNFKKEDEKWQEGHEISVFILPSVKNEEETKRKTEYTFQRTTVPSVDFLAKCYEWPVYQKDEVFSAIKPIEMVMKKYYTDAMKEMSMRLANAEITSHTTNEELIRVLETNQREICEIAGLVKEQATVIKMLHEYVKQIFYGHIKNSKLVKTIFEWLIFRFFLKSCCKFNNLGKGTMGIKFL